MSDGFTVAADVIGAVASLVANELNSNPIPMGEQGFHRIIHVSHADRDREAHLRTDNGEMWILRAVKLGQTMRQSGGEDETRVRKDFARYQELVKSAEHAVSYAKKLGIEDEDLALQTYHDEVMNDDERECWARWVSGGYASDAEWHLVGSGD